MPFCLTWQPLTSPHPPPPQARALLDLDIVSDQTWMYVCLWLGLHNLGSTLASQHPNFKLGCLVNLKCCEH